MSKQYRVTTPTGIDLGGRRIPIGKEFSPGSHGDWCEKAVKAGALERVEEKSAKKKTAGA